MQAGRARRTVPVIGHVHLRAGDVDVAERWWNELGLETMVHYGSGRRFSLAKRAAITTTSAPISGRAVVPAPRAPDRAGLSFRGDVV